jgi:hypothetical protein
LDTFFDGFHFRKGLEEDAEGEFPSPPVLSSSCTSGSAGGAEGAGGGFGATWNPFLAVVTSLIGPQKAQQQASCQL